MAENICLMLTQSDSHNVLVRVLSLAAAGVDLHQRTVLYVGGRWIDLARAGVLEQHERILKPIYKGLSVMELFRHFQNAGGQLWVSSSDAQRQGPDKRALIEGVTFVDEKTLLTFLTLGTVVLNF